MKKVLVIGSTVVDVIINVDKLPTTKGDIHVKTQTAQLGGCAYNVFDVIHNFEIPSILFSPVGTGIYGEFVRNRLNEKGINMPIPSPDMDNGCCYCFVEDHGERTFISNHGAEYLFYKEWFDMVNLNEIDSIYVCGLEVEETTGHYLVDFLEKAKDIPLFFAPGPRIVKIKQELIDRMYALNPVLHMNDDEIIEYIGNEDIGVCAKELYARTNNTVIVTCGSNGAYYYNSDDDCCLVDAVLAEKIVDTIGAGDAHIGGIMSGLYKGMNLKDAIYTANKIASKIVSVKGAQLSKEEFEEAIK